LSSFFSEIVSEGDLELNFGELSSWAPVDGAALSCLESVLDSGDEASDACETLVEADDFGCGKDTWGPMKKRCSCAAGKHIVSCSQACGGKDDSARAPSMNTRT
jgi:hypothetical protein